MWENQGSQLNSRAKSQLLTENSWLVSWKGGDYIVQRVLHSKKIWKIRRRNNVALIHILTEREGLGKEEAIAWIEANC